MSQDKITDHKARAFAIRAHADQRYGEHPYSVHLDRVASLARAHGFADDESIAAAYLHDVLEDSEVTGAELEAEFGSRVMKAVAFCSDEPGPNRKTRKSATYARMKTQVEAKHGWIALAIRTKVADRLANASACAANNPSMLEMYRSEHPTFRASLFVAGVCDSMWEELTRVLG